MKAMKAMEAMKASEEREKTKRYGCVDPVIGWIQIDSRCSSFALRDRARPSTIV